MKNNSLLILGAAVLAYFLFRKKENKNDLTDSPLPKSAQNLNTGAPIATSDRRLWLLDYISRTDKTGETMNIFRRMSDPEIDASYQYVTQYLMTGSKPIPGDSLYIQIQQIGRKYLIFG